MATDPGRGFCAGDLRARGGDLVMPGTQTRWTTETVLAWIAENRPDFKVNPGWVHVTTTTPIPGSCMVCGAECSPRLDNMKSGDLGHCNSCAKRATGAAKRANAESAMLLLAEQQGYEVVRFFTRRYKSTHFKSGYSDRTHATMRCHCGNEWDVSQGNFCTNNRGCPSCAEFGYSTDKPGAMYLLVRTVDGVEQRQFGISNDWKTRTAGYKRFGWRLKDVVIWQDGSVARRHEDRMNALVREVGQTVEPDHIKYKNTEAFVDGVGIPMFVGIHDLLHWLGEDNG